MKRISNETQLQTLSCTKNIGFKLTASKFFSIFRFGSVKWYHLNGKPNCLKCNLQRWAFFLCIWISMQLFFCYLKTNWRKKLMQKDQMKVWFKMFDTAFFYYSKKFRQKCMHNITNRNVNCSFNCLIKKNGPQRAKMNEKNLNARNKRVIWKWEFHRGLK